MEASDIAWEPHGYYKTKSHLARFMEAYGYESYEDLIPRTEDNIARFWADVVEDAGIVWDTDYDTVLDTSDGIPFTKWFVGGELNITQTILDKWVEQSPDRVMYYWENEHGKQEEHTFAEIANEVNVMANALRDHGIGPGDTVGLVFPLHPHGMIASLACLKIGAVQTQIFAGYGARAISERLEDCAAELLFIADGYYRGGEILDLRSKVDESLDTTAVDTVVTDELVGLDGGITTAEEVRWPTFTAGAGPDAETEIVTPEDPAVIAYSSGTTGKPKGTIHTHTSMFVGIKESKYQFDTGPGDVFSWVTDFGWVVVPVWMISGAPALGASVLLVGGAPDHPSADRLFELIDRYGVTTLGISPTGARGLRQANETPRADHDLSSLRVLGSTGEPWDRQTWRWFFEEFGGGHLPIMNISGGTELAGGITCPSPLTPLKPGTLWGPEIGVPTNVYGEDGQPADEGYLVVEGPMPGMTHSLTDGDERYLEEYWSDFDDAWNQNDWVEKDADGHWFITGRADDTMNVSGRRITAPELEGVLLEDPAITEAAVIGVADDRRGQVPVGFVVLADGTDDLTRESVNERITDTLGAPFRLAELHIVAAMPRTQTGKIPRGRIEMTYEGEPVDDVSTLENGEVLDGFPRRGQ